MKKNFAFAMLLLPVGPPTSWRFYVLIRWLLTSCHSSQKPHRLLVQSTNSSQEGKAGPLCFICMRLLCQVQWAPFASSIMRAGKLTQPRSLTRKSTQTGSLRATVLGLSSGGSSHARPGRASSCSSPGKGKKVGIFYLNL